MAKKKRKQSKRKNGIIGWRADTVYALSARHNDRVAAVIVTRASGSWGVTAVESTVESAATLAGVFDNHAHEVIGEFKSLRLARKAAEKYGRAWLKNKKMAPPCECGPIITAPSPMPAPTPSSAALQS